MDDKIKKPKPADSGQKSISKDRIIVCNMRIIALANGYVRVKNFSNNLYLNLSVLHGAQKIIVDYFVKAAKDGQLSDKNVIRPDQIRIPKNLLSRN